MGEYSLAGQRAVSEKRTYNPLAASGRNLNRQKRGRVAGRELEPFGYHEKGSLGRLGLR